MLKEERIDGIVIAGDINQDVTSDRIQKFIRENGCARFIKN